MDKFKALFQIGFAMMMIPVVLFILGIGCFLLYAVITNL